MTNELKQYLDQAGFGERLAQTRLYRHLTSIEEDGAICEYGGVVAQAGTGTGKSAAIISAAAHHARATGRQSLIVTPTLTLMNQYRDGDMPVAKEAFPDLTLAELRGRAHYHCEMAESVAEVMRQEYRGGCEGSDGGCTMKGALGCTDACMGDCDFDHKHRWRCEYQIAKAAAMVANVVVTNADMLIVNDRILAQFGGPIFDLEGALLVDEAHTLDQKLRDYASRSLFHRNLERFKFADDAGARLAKWVERQDRNIAIKDARGFPSDALLAIAHSHIPEPAPNDGLARQREMKEACERIAAYMADPHDSAVLHVGQGSLKMDWVNVSQSSGELISARDFGLVSATVPRTMAATLGVPNAPFIDVGHPFDYPNQAWIGFSAYGGDYRSAQHDSNFEQRVGEVMDLIRKSRGGALVLFSSFADLERVAERLTVPIRTELGVTVLKQDREMQASERQHMADMFKAAGDAVLFGSESFATGFDVPGDALRLVVLWKLPYPAVDPVNTAIMNSNRGRYEDMMKVRAVQAIGRLIRRETDKGLVWIADNRGRRLLDANDPLTNHIPTFARWAG